MSDGDSGCVPFGEGGWLCHGPKMEEHSASEWGERWCFVCRKRRSFTHRVMVPVGMSYYGPYSTVKCDVCRTEDADVFPGRERIWEEV